MDISSLKTSLIPGKSTESIEVRDPTKIKSQPRPEEQRITNKQVSLVLDKMMRNTRFQYVINDKINYFIVRIIDKETDKVIREIPSQELQRVHRGIEDTLGILFDELI